MQKEWANMANEKRVGILHAFILLKPLLKRAFRT